jgi:GNAT superfamily N-acetyltransferase
MEPTAQHRLQRHLRHLAPGAQPHAAAADTAAPTDPTRVTVKSYFGEQLDRQTWRRCQEILQRSFYGGPNRKTGEPYNTIPEGLLLTGAAQEKKVDGLLAQAVHRRERWHLAVDKEDGALAALATTFEHTMVLADGTRRVILALGEVATHPLYRGRGHGAAAVRAAFGEVSVSGERDVMLWQTGNARGLCVPRPLHTTHGNTPKNKLHINYPYMILGLTAFAPRPFTNSIATRRAQVREARRVSPQANPRRSSATRRHHSQTY